MDTENQSLSALDAVANTAEFHAAVRKFGVLKAGEASGIPREIISRWLGGGERMSLERRLHLAETIGWRILVRAVPPRANKTYAGKRPKKHRANRW